MTKPMRSLTSIKRDFAGAARVMAYKVPMVVIRMAAWVDAEAIVLSQWLLEDIGSSSCSERSRGRWVGFRIPTGKDGLI